MQTTTRRIIPFRCLAISAAIAVAAFAFTASAEPLMVGAEFQVNTYTTYLQSGAPAQAVARSSDGSFVVVWQSVGQDGSSNSVHGQRYDADGVADGTEFQINSYTTNAQVSPAASSAADGSFVVVWRSDGQVDDPVGIFGQRFDGAGSPAGTEFHVNSYTTTIQERPAVASAPDGSFVVAWESSGQDGDGVSIHGQRFDAAGLPAGTEFQVNSYTTLTQYRADVSSAPDGSFVVVWTSNSNQDGSLRSVHGQRYDAAGLAAGTEFQVNTYTTDVQYNSQVASHADGSFVVVWSSAGNDGNSNGIGGRRYDAAGDPVGTEFVVNSYTTDSQYRPAVVADGDGKFVVVWGSFNQDGSADSIQGQRFDANGDPDGTQFQANSFTTGYQYRPSVASDGAGNFAVVWNSQYQDDGVAGGVFAQLVCADDDADALCNSADACTNVGGAQDIDVGPKLIIKKINTDTTVGNDGLLVKGEFVLAAATSFANLDPITNGARVVIENAAGTALVDVTIPGGAFNGTVGWTTNGSASKYQFKDRAAPAANNGITKLKIQDRSNRAPNQVKVLVKGKNGNYPVTPADLPVRAVVVTGQAVAGQCGETAFAPAACSFNGSGKTLKCQQ